MTVPVKHIILSVTLIALLAGCKTTSKIAKDDAGSKLSEKQRVDLDRAFMEGQRAKAIEDNDEAIKNFREVIKIDPKNADAHYEVSTLLYAANKFDDALVESDQAVKLSPNNKWYLEQMAGIQMKKNNVKDAIKSYEQLTKISPNDPDNYFDLAYLYLQTNQPDMAIKTYDQFEKTMALRRV